MPPMLGHGQTFSSRLFRRGGTQNSLIIVDFQRTRDLYVFNCIMNCIFNIGFIVIYDSKEMIRIVLEMQRQP